MVRIGCVAPDGAFGSVAEWSEVAGSVTGM